MSIWEDYQNEINFFERRADELLVETIIHETKMDKRKQQQLQPTEEDIDHLLKMIVAESDSHYRNLSIFSNVTNTADRSKYVFVLR